jgi:predicted transcriptional regulator
MTRDRQTEPPVPDAVIGKPLESQDDPIVAAIKRGMADVKAGRVVPHEEVVRRIHETIRRASK